MRVLVTGGTGFIGSHLVDALVARGDEVLILDDLSTGRLENVAGAQECGGVELVDGSILDEVLVEKCMKSVDACLHLASAVGVQLILANPVDSLRLNVRGNDIVISAAARLDRTLLFTSTSEIYGKNSQQAPLAENADRILGPTFKARWAYSTAKGFGETLCHAYHSQNGAPTIVTRLFNTVGPRQTGAYGMVLPRFVRQALAGESLTVFGDGSQSRCFTHVWDTVDAILALLDTELAVGQVYNVGSSIDVSIVELAERVIKAAESSSSLRFIPYEEAYGEGFEELGRRVPDTSALRQLTGWRPTRRVDDIIADVVAHERRAALRRAA